MFTLGFRLVTRRLVIRRMRPDDWKDLYEYLSDPQTVRFEPYDVYTKADAMLEAANRANRPDFLAVCLQSNGKMIGNLYFAHREEKNYELGYVFNRKYRGKNYAYESCAALITFAFQKMDIQRVFAECDARNERSFHLMERLGMKMEESFMGEDFTKQTEKTRCFRYGISQNSSEKIAVYRYNCPEYEEIH